MTYTIYVTEMVHRRREFVANSDLTTEALERDLRELLNGDIKAEPALGGEARVLNCQFGVTAIKKEMP